MSEKNKETTSNVSKDAALSPNENDMEEKVVKKKSVNVAGIVHNCNSLRLREGATVKSRELARLPVDTKVNVNLKNSTESFYEVTYSINNINVIGFCLKEFIRIE